MTTPRSIGTFALLALGINGVVGVGIFFAPSELALAAGRRGSVLVLLAVAAALVPVAATFSILGRRFAEDGGPVTFARAAFGERVAFAVGWLAYASALFSTSAVISGLTNALFSGPLVMPVSIAVALALAGVSALGVDVSKRTWSAVTLAKLAPLVGLAVLALVMAPRSWGAATAPAITSELSLSRAALSACFVLQGFEVVPVIAGAAKTPERSVPIAIYGTLGFAAVLYAILQWGFVATVPDVSTGAPLVASATALGGTSFGNIVHATTSVSALGIAFGMIVTTPRYLSALVLGSRLARTNARGVPTSALIATLIVVVALLALGKLGELFALASLAVIVQYAVVACALVKLAGRRKLGLSTKHLAPAIGTLVVAAALLGAPSRAEWVVFGLVAASGLGVRAAFRVEKPPI